MKNFEHHIIGTTEVSKNGKQKTKMRVIFKVVWEKDVLPLTEEERKMMSELSTKICDRMRNSKLGF